MGKRDWMSDPYFRAKAASYKTARVCDHVLTHNGEHDLEAGEYVAVTFTRERVHPWTKEIEPMFSITRIGGKVWGEIGAASLDSFCL